MLSRDERGRTPDAHPAPDRFCVSVKNATYRPLPISSSRTTVSLREFRSLLTDVRIHAWIEGQLIEMLYVLEGIEGQFFQIHFRLG